jgi:hypothetical protein
LIVRFPALIVLLLLLSIFPISNTKAIQPTASATTCSANPPWFEERSELGGTYVSDNWENNYIHVLQLTLFGDEVMGFLTVTVLEPLQVASQDILAISGTVSGNQISLKVDLGLGSSYLMLGEWTTEFIRVQRPVNGDSLATTTYFAANEAITQQSMDRLQNRPHRDRATAIILDELFGSSKRLAGDASFFVGPFGADELAVTEELQLPGNSELGLHSYGWVTTGTFTYRDGGYARDQVNDVYFHVVSDSVMVAPLIQCARDALDSAGAIDLGSEYPELDSIVALKREATARMPAYVQVIATNGRAIVTAIFVGSNEDQATGLQEVSDLLIASAYNVP